MLEFCMGSYVVLGILITFLLWSAMGAAKRADEVEEQAALRRRK